MSSLRDRQVDFEGVEDLGEGIISRPPQVSLSVECLCGMVHGVINGPVPHHQICHCRNCKKITGGTHGDFLVVKANRLIFTRGNSVMSVYQVGAPFNTVKFVYRCGECCTPIYVKRSDLQSTDTFVFVGCLVNTEWLDQHGPDDEIQKTDKCVWLPKLRRTGTPSSESDIELVSAEPDIEIVSFRLSASEDSESDE
ncbi:hypothetical protein K449DRAFT_403788 [Hypoxylon sp. EC38]|nr:hypothetical protein K449DRAFT_403788 [Hypoxylon sp. EC38]